MALPQGDEFRAAAIAQLVPWRTLMGGEDTAMTQKERELRETNERIFQEFCHSLRIEGLREGKSEGLRVAVRNLCEVLDIPMSDKHAQTLAPLNSEGLEALLLQIKRDRVW